MIEKMCESENKQPSIMMQNTHGLNDIRRVEGNVLYAWSSIIIYIFLRKGEIWSTLSYLNTSLFTVSLTI